MPGAVLGSNRRNDMTNLKTTIVGQFSALNDTDAGRAACLEYDTAVAAGASSDQAEVQASNVLQRAGFDVNRHGGASFETSATESAGVLESVFDDAAAERDAALESAFADAIGHDKYQRLLDESWQPFAGKAHLSMSLEDAVAREVKAATEFLETLADDKQEHIISAVLGEDAEVIELSFDPVRPESPVFYRYPDVSEDWQSCPFQSADVRHLSDEAACAMVNNWVG
jgi:hypothetical protein